MSLASEIARTIADTEAWIARKTFPSVKAKETAGFVLCGLKAAHNQKDVPLLRRTLARDIATLEETLRCG